RRRDYTPEFTPPCTAAAAQPGTTFVPNASHLELDRIFSIHHERTVNNDNTVRLANITLHIQPTIWRSTLAGCRGVVQERLDDTIFISFGPHQVGRFPSDRQPIRELQLA